MDSHSHVVSVKLYVAIFLTLMMLTTITVAVAFVDLGPFSNVIALTIAVTKATLVILYFMHVRYSSRLTWLVVSTGFFWLAVMIVFTLSDSFTRGLLGYPGR
ncbi:MAG TPA: cytochrome C oxidase subunit IV family protein [Candidatus Kryptonia bacterium]|nr:cytochrome C oxidase subunit IV family protein [Candidatus Kryptonia bacterium]